MSDNSLNFTVIDNCRCRIYVSSVQLIGNTADTKVVATVSYESSLSVKGFQLDFDFPWVSKFEILSPDMIGNPVNDIDVFQQRRFPANDASPTWGLAIDSSPDSQQIIAWDISGVDNSIPATFDVIGGQAPKGPRVLCRVVLTPDDNFLSILNDSEVPPSITEISNGLRRAIAVSFQMGASNPVETWSPEIIDEQSIANFIANDIFDAHHNGYKLSSDAKTAEEDWLMGSIHVGDVVACQELLDQGLANPETKDYSEYSVVPSVICNKTADTSVGRYESNCIGTQLSCSQDERRKLTLDLFALPTGGSDAIVPDPAKTCEIAGYHIITEIKLPFDTDDFDTVSATSLGGKAQGAGLQEYVRCFETIDEKKYIEVFAFPNFNKDEQFIESSESPVQLTRIELDVTVPFDMCDNLSGWEENVVEELQSGLGYAVPLHRYTSHGVKGTRIWNYNPAFNSYFSEEWNGNSSYEELIEKKDWEFLVEAVTLNGGTPQSLGFGLDASGDGELDVGDIIALVNWLRENGNVDAANQYSALSPVGLAKEAGKDSVTVAANIVPSLCCDNFGEREEEEPQVFRNNCGCQLEKLSCSERIDGKTDIALSLKYQPSTVALSGFEFTAEIPQAMTVDDVQLGLGGDAKAAGLRIMSAVYFDQQLQKNLLKIIGFGLRIDEGQTEYPEIPAGGGPVLVNFVLAGVDAATGCPSENIFTSTKLELYTNTNVSFAAPTWNGDYNQDGVITIADVIGLAENILLSEYQYPSNVNAAGQLRPSVIDLIAISNWMFENGIDSTVPTPEFITTKVVPQRTCSDSCRVVWEPEKYSVPDECVLDYKVKSLTQVSHTDSAEGIVENLNLPFDYSPQWKDLVLEIEYKSSCNLAGVQFDLDLLGLPSDCYRIKGVFGADLPNTQNWVWRYDAKGISRTVVGLINGCCDEQVQQSDVGIWQSNPETCPPTGQIPFDLDGRSLCYVVVDAQKCPDIDLSDASIAELKNQKGVTFDKSGGRLSGNWTGKRPDATTLKIGSYDFETCLSHVVSQSTSSYPAQFDANGDGSVDVLDAVFLAQCMFYCLPYGPYSIGAVGLAGTIDGYGDQTFAAVTTHATVTPRLTMPAYCECDEDKTSCKGELELIDVKCDDVEGVIVATVAYTSPENSVAGLQFDLARNFEADSVTIKELTVTNDFPYVAHHKEHKNVFNSAYVDRVILAPNIGDNSSRFTTYILPQQSRETAFVQVVYRGVDLGRCECPTTKLYVYDESRQHGTKKVEYRGRTYKGQDGNLWTGSGVSKTARRVYKEVEGITLCQARMVTNDIREAIKSYPTPKLNNDGEWGSFDPTAYLWSGDPGGPSDAENWNTYINSAINNGIAPDIDGNGEYKYYLDANWDGKIDIADIIAFYNWLRGLNHFVDKVIRVVPSYICDIKDFNSCSRPNCCDGEPCSDTDKTGGLYLHFSPPKHVQSFSQEVAGPSWSQVYAAFETSAIPESHTIVEVKLCAKNSDIKYIHTVQFELDLPEGVEVVAHYSGEHFYSSQLQSDNRTIVVSGGPEGSDRWMPNAAITAEAGPLTVATLMLSPVLKEKLCFGCGKEKRVVVSECCPDASGWRPYEVYVAGNKVKGIKLYNKETGEEIDISLYRFLNYKKDEQGNPLLDENGERIWELVLDAGSFETIPVVVVETGDCWEHMGHFGKPAQAIPSAIPGTEAGNRFWTLFCNESVVTEYEGGTHVITSGVPFKHPSASLEMFECYDKERSRNERNPTFRKIYYNPELFGSLSYMEQVYDNVTTNAGDAGGNIVIGLNSTTTYNENVGSTNTDTRLAATINPDIFNIKDSRFNELTFGECHPCVTCCSPEADSYPKMKNYNAGMYFPSGDIDLYLQIAGPNLIDVKYCTDKRISFFQLGIKLNEGYKIVQIDESEGVASNTDYDLTLSKYSSVRDSGDVYVVTGQVNRDDCLPEQHYGDVNYIGGCSDGGHQTLFRIELKSDSQSEVVWGREVLDAAVKEVSIDVLSQVVLAFNKHDSVGMFFGKLNDDWLLTENGRFIYDEDTQRLIFKDPYDIDGTKVPLYGYDLFGAGVNAVVEIEFPQNPHNVEVYADGSISVDGVVRYRIAFVKTVDGATFEPHPTYNVYWNADNPTSNLWFEPALDYTLVRHVVLTIPKRTTELATDKLRCPPLFPSDVCFSNFITEVMCIHKPTKFTAVTLATQSGYIDPETGEFVTACDGAIEWDASYDYKLGDRVWVDEECECYEYICEEPPVEECCCPPEIDQTTLYDPGAVYQKDDCVWLAEASLIDTDTYGNPKGMMLQPQYNPDGSVVTTDAGLPVQTMNGTSNTPTAIQAYNNYSFAGVDLTLPEIQNFIWGYINSWTYNESQSLAGAIDDANDPNIGVLHHAETGDAAQRFNYWMYGTVMNISVSCYKALQEVAKRNPRSTTNNEYWKETENCICCGDNFSNWTQGAYYSKYDVVKGCDGNCYMWISNTPSGDDWDIAGFQYAIATIAAAINAFEAFGIDESTWQTLLNNGATQEYFNAYLDGNPDFQSYVGDAGICESYKYFSDLMRGDITVADQNALTRYGLIWLVAGVTGKLEVPGSTPAWAKLTCCACTTAELWNQTNHYVNGQNILWLEPNSAGGEIELKCYKAKEYIPPLVDGATFKIDTSTIYSPDLDNDPRFEQDYCCDLSTWAQPWTSGQTYPIGTEVWQNIIEYDGKYYFPLKGSGPLAKENGEPVGDELPNGDGGYWLEIICPTEPVEDYCLNPKPGVDADWELTWKYSPACIEDCDTGVFIKSGEVKIPEPCEDPECEPICKDVQVLEGCCIDAVEFNPKNKYSVGDVVWFGSRDNCWKFVGEIQSECDENTPLYVESDHLSGAYATGDLVTYEGKCWRYKGPIFEPACDSQTQVWDNVNAYNTGDVVLHNGDCYEYKGIYEEVIPCCDLENTPYWEMYPAVPYVAGDIVTYAHTTIDGDRITQCYTYNPQMTTVTTTETQTVTETATITPAILDGVYGENTVTAVNGQSTWNDSGTTTAWDDETLYFTGDIVLTNGILYMLADRAALLASAIGCNFDYSFYCDPNNTPNFDPYAEYNPGDLVKIDGAGCYRLKDNCVRSFTEETQNNFEEPQGGYGENEFDNTFFYETGSIVIADDGNWYRLDGPQGTYQVQTGTDPDCSGTWTEEQQYNTNDTVMYDGQCYRLDGTPTETTGDPTPISEDECSTEGSIGTFSTSDSAFYPRTEDQGDYPVGTYVYLTDGPDGPGCYYKTGAGTLSVSGTTSETVYDSSVVCPDAASWDENVEYYGGDIVEYNGSCYRVIGGASIGGSTESFSQQNISPCTLSNGDKIKIAVYPVSPMGGQFGEMYCGQEFTIEEYSSQNLADDAGWTGNDKIKLVKDGNTCYWRRCIRTTTSYGGGGNWGGTTYPGDGGGYSGGYETSDECTAWTTNFITVCTVNTPDQDTNMWELVESTQTVDTYEYQYDPTLWELTTSAPTTTFEAPDTDNAWTAVTPVPTYTTYYLDPYNDSSWTPQSSITVRIYDYPNDDPCWEEPVWGPTSTCYSDPQNGTQYSVDGSNDPDSFAPIWQTTVDVSYETTVEVTEDIDLCQQEPVVNPYDSVQAGDGCWSLCETLNLVCDGSSEPGSVGSENCWELLPPVDVCIVPPQLDSPCWELAQQDPCCVEGQTVDGTTILLDCVTPPPDGQSICWEECVGGSRIEEQCEDAPCLPCCPDALPYDAERSYDIGEMVAHNGDCWTSLKEGLLGTPGEFDPNTVAATTPDWELYVCERDCIETEVDASGGITLKAGKATIPVWYRTSCTNISGFSFKITGVPDCVGDYYSYDYYGYSSSPSMTATLQGGVSALADFMLTVYKDEYGDWWVVGVLTDLKKLIQPTSQSGKLLTNVIFNVEEWQDCFDWSQVKVCAPRFTSNTKLSEVHSMWTGDTNSDGYITAKDVEASMMMVGESWNSYHFEGPWKEFIDAQYDGMIRVEDAVTIQNHRLMNADDSGIVRPGTTEINSAGNSLYGSGSGFTSISRANVTRTEPVSKNIVPQVCCEEEIYADCLCPCDEPVETPCYDNVRMKLIPARIKQSAYDLMASPEMNKKSGNPTIDGYFIQVYYSSSCCLDGYWVEFDGLNNIPGSELNLYPAPVAEPVKKKWLEYTGWGPDSYLIRGPLDQVPNNVIFGWYRAPYIGVDGNPSFFSSGANNDSSTVAVTHYEKDNVPYQESCIPATKQGEWKVLATVFVRKEAVNTDAQGRPVPPTIKNYRLVTNEKMNLPAENWTGDVAGFDGTITLGPDGKVGVLDEVGAMLAAIVGANGNQVPMLDAEGDGKYLDIVDIVTIWNHYTQNVLSAIAQDGPLAVINGAALPKPRVPIVPTDCCPEACDKPGDFKLTVVDCKEDSTFGCDGKYPNSIGLKWTESENATGYRVYRSDNPLVPIHVSYDPSVTQWIDIDPPVFGSQDETITIGTGKTAVTIDKNGCCGDDDLEPVYYAVIAFNDCGEVSSGVEKGELCCCNEGPQAKDYVLDICVNETKRAVFVAYDPDVPPFSNCNPAVENCDALYYEVVNVTNGTVSPPVGHLQPGPVGQFEFTPDQDFVGIATVEFKVYDTSGCWDCGIVVFRVLPEAPKIENLITSDCYESGYGTVKVAWNEVPGAVKYKVYRRKNGETNWNNIVTVSAPVTFYVDANIPELPSEDCEEGILYEYVVSAVVEVVVPVGGLKPKCGEEESSSSDTGKVSNKDCCASLFKSQPELASKISKYETIAAEKGWEKICSARKMFLLYFGFTWEEIGIIDCCCGKPFYELSDISTSEEQAYKNVSSQFSIDGAREDYKRGYILCCDDVTPAGTTTIMELESCIDPVIPKPDICCADYRVVEIPCCPKLTCDDWDIYVSSTDCGDTGHPTISVWWNPVPGASSYAIKAKLNGNTVYENNSVGLPTETSPFTFSVPPCYCPDDNQQIDVVVTAVNGSGNAILECGEAVDSKCCTIPLGCPPEQDRTWYIDKNEVLFGKVAPVVSNNPNCADEDITYSLVIGDDDCCPDFDEDGNHDCGPFNGTVYKKSTYYTTKEVGIDENGEFVYVPNPHWVSEYDEDGNPLLPTQGGPDSFTYRAVDCCGEEVCCTITVHVVIDVCDENDYVICDATIAYLSSQFVKGPLNPEQVPFSLNRRGGQTLRYTRRAYVVTKGMNPLLDPDYE